MKNRILYLTRTSIPYVKELLPIAHSIPGCLLMQQLDFFFERKQNGFYKFMESCPHALYRPGDSWVEELGISAVEFRTTFDRFGIRYKSKSEFDATPDKFQGKFYCSYHDKRAQLTWYFRNHELLDAALDKLLMTEKTPESPPNGGGNGDFRPNFPVSAPSAPTVNALGAFTGTTPSAVTVNAPSASTVKRPPQVTGTAPSTVAVAAPSVDLEALQPPIMEVVQVHSGITENEQDFQRPLLQRGEGASDHESSSSILETSFEDLVFPAKILPEEKAVLLDLLAGCPATHRQQVLDEIEGYSRAGKITAGMVPLGRSLVRSVGSGAFKVNLGVSVLAARSAAGRQAAQPRAMPDAPAATWDDVSPEVLAKMPKFIRDQAEGRVKGAP